MEGGTKGISTSVGKRGAFFMWEVCGQWSKHFTGIVIFGPLGLGQVAHGLRVLQEHLKSLATANA